MITKIVKVVTEVEVTLDETKFDEEFFKEYTTHFSSSMDELDDHFLNIAWLYATGRFQFPSEFVEGYGPLTDFGVKCDIILEDQTIED